MTTKQASKPARTRPRGRSTAGIIQAAKAAGAESITFPDGTVVKLPATDSKPDKHRSKPLQPAGDGEGRDG